MEKSDLDGWVSSKTSTEKLYEIFLRRYRRLWDDAGSGMREHDLEEMWWDMLKSIKGLAHIRKFSDLAESTDYLLECVNEPKWDKVVIRDPCERKNFILLDREFAERVLVLGDIP